MVFASVAMLAQPAHAQEFTAPSVVRAQDETTLSSLIPGTIVKLPFKEGDAFQEGDVLVGLDCSIYQSEADAARADSDAAMARARARARLFSRGGIGRLEVDVAKAESVAAAARVKTADKRVEACQIHAPFDGRVADNVVSAFEYVEPGQPILTIVSSGTPDLEIIAPAEWLVWVEPGTKGRLRLSARDQSLEVAVVQLGPVVDPVSRTVKLTAMFEEDASGVLPGMSGVVTLERPE